MQIRFVKDDNNELVVSDTSEWRLAKDGLEGFSVFEADLTTTQDYARDGERLEHIRLSGKTRTISICNVDWISSCIISCIKSTYQQVNQQDGLKGHCIVWHLMSLLIKIICLNAQCLLSMKALI